MSEKTARPRLTLADIELLKDGLDLVSLDSKDLDVMHACSELSARLEQSSWPLRPRWVDPHHHVQPDDHLHHPI